MVQVKKVRRPVNGILVLDKPLGLTSNAALQKVRWLLNAEKAGHTGSLDPLATGVLPLCFGEATKFSQYLLDADKGYETLMQLGATTTTGDAEGDVLERRPVTTGQKELEAVLPQFRGPIQQIPPMYSALKKDGQPLYKLARAGEVVERAARSVTILRLELLACTTDKARLQVACSKGTYIRTLVEDIGQVLGCGAYVAELRRTQAGPFNLSQAVSLNSLSRFMQKAALRRWISSFCQRIAVCSIGRCCSCPNTVLITGYTGNPSEQQTRRSLAGCGYKIMRDVSSVSVKCLKTGV